MTEYENKQIASALNRIAEALEKLARYVDPPTVRAARPSYNYPNPTEVVGIYGQR